MDWQHFLLELHSEKTFKLPVRQPGDGQSRGLFWTQAVITAFAIEAPSMPGSPITPDVSTPHVSLHNMDSKLCASDSEVTTTFHAVSLFVYLFSIFFSEPGTVVA